MKIHHALSSMLLICSSMLAVTASAASDPLPSWNEGQSKTALTQFVAAVTTPDSKDFVPAAERIAVFDNDGTLWAEQPAYFQLFFAIDRVKALAPQHPEWKKKQPFKAALEGDMKTLAASGEKGLFELVMASHAGMSTDEFQKIVSDWVATARHPQSKSPYTEMVYQPMLEVLTYLRANGFKTYIVSGGGVEFMRAWAEKVYGIPPEQVIGSTVKTQYVVKNGVPTITRLPKLDFMDDKEGKPININRIIGRKPLAAFGNSDGDFQMLEWTTSAPGKRFALFVHHDDAAREYAYDRKSSIGTLARGLDEAPKRGWTVVSMKNDWKTIFPTAQP